MINTEILILVMVAIGQFGTMGIAIAIFASIFLKNRKKGYLFLAVLLTANIYTLIIMFGFSATFGYVTLWVDICLAAGGYLIIKWKTVGKL